MAFRHGSLSAFVAAALIAAPACGSNGGDTTAASQTDGTTAQTTSSTGTTDGTTTSATDSTSEGTGSASMASQPTTTGEPTTSTTSDPSTTSSTTAVEETTTDTTTSSTASSTGTTEPIDETSSSTGPDCVPSPETCNKLDDDCDGVVDNVDEGGDGICDCLSIALFGNEGWIPSSEFQAYLEAQGTSVERISLDNTPITQEILNKYDIIILDWLVRTYSPEEAALIKGWVEAGGGLMGMTGHVSENVIAERANSILGATGLTYNTSKGFFDGPVTNWLQGHPISKDITSVSFKGGLYVDMADDGVGMNTVVATLPQGPVAVAQIRLDGKVFAFGDEWIEFDSEWQQIPQIKQLWVNILGWLSPQNYCTIPQ